MTLEDLVLKIVLHVLCLPRGILKGNFLAGSNHLLEGALRIAFHDHPTEPSISSSPAKVMDYLPQSKSISELELYGIKVKVNSSDMLLNQPRIYTKYKDGELRLPTVRLNELTTTLYWNFLALEQQPDFSGVRIFQSFIVLMSTLIQTQSDVEILIKKRGILIDKMKIMRSDMLFNDLSKKVRNIQETRFTNIVKEVNDHCKEAIPKLRAYFMRNYYDARWDVLQSFLLFVLTVTQTFFVVLSYRGDSRSA